MRKRYLYSNIHQHMLPEKTNKYAVRKEIAALIDSIKEHSDSIGTRRHIPQIELELILHKIEKLYQKSIVFNYLNSIDGGEGVSGETQASAKIETAKDWGMNLSELTESIPQPEPPVLQTEESIETVSEEIKPAEPKAELTATPKTEVVQPEKKESIAPPPPAAKKYPEMKVGLNEKIMFTRQLFGNDSAAYNEALKQLNACASPAEAGAFLDVLKGEYRWKADDEAAQLFFELAKRRFS